MFKIRTIFAENFMSFKKVEYTFEDRCYIIKAQNFDNDGQQSNGGGKTSLVDILAVTLLGYSLTGRNVKDCVNWNTETSSFTVGVYLENLTYKLSCYIQRTVYSNTRGQELVLLVNDKVPSTLPTKKGVVNGVDVKAGNEYILKELLDIKEQDLLNYYLISKNYYQPFLQVNTDKKLEVISRFTNTTAVDKVIKRLEINFETDKDGLVEYDYKLNQIQGYITALSDSCNEDARLIFQQTKDAELESITKLMTSLEEKLALLDSEAIKHTEEIDKLEKKIVAIDLEKKKEFKIQYDTLNEKEFIELKRELGGEIARARNFLAGQINCPKCKHKFHLTSKEEWTETQVIELDNGLIEVENEHQSLIKTKTKLREELDLIESSERENKRVQFEITNHKRTIKSIEEQQERILDEHDKLTGQFDTKGSETFEKHISIINQQISRKEEELEEVRLQHKELEIELQEKKKWIDLFSDFKFYLGNKPLELICSLVNQYLKLNESDLSLHIEGFKKIRSGELRQALTPVIYRNWMNPQSFSQYSEGEKTRLNLTTDLAFQQLINSSSKHGGLDFYANDEILNPLDSMGIGNAAEAFDKIKKTIVLVTHSGADLHYHNTIMIEKKDGISQII